MKKLLVLLACSVALVAAGCGDDDDDDGGGGGGAGTQAEQPAQEPSGAEPAASAVKVSMKDTLYVPMDVKVKAGGTITWTNDDPFAHTVTKGSGPGPKFDSGTVNGGETYKRKFDTPGKLDYLCTIHPNQTGTITVE